VRRGKAGKRHSEKKPSILTTGGGPVRQGPLRGRGDTNEKGVLVRAASKKGKRKFVGKKKERRGNRSKEEVAPMKKKNQSGKGWNIGS